MSGKRLEHGLFITFEGGEGSGKTTQINRLAANLTDLGYKVLTTREPGATVQGEKIRQLLLRADHDKAPGDAGFTPMAEMLLFFAARAMLVTQVIQPALQEGRIVICDRFTDSTRAYQGYGHDLPLSDIEAVKHIVLGDLEPDLTFILDIAPDIGLGRTQERFSTTANLDGFEDRFEQMDLDFHHKVRDGFLTLAKTNTERYKCLDASMDKEALANMIKSHILTTLETIEGKGRD